MKKITALVLASALMASATTATAGGLGGAVTDPDVVVPTPVGSLGGGLIVPALVIGVAAIALLTNSDSGSH